jgi:outer membrane protein insertion porin family
MRKIVVLFALLMGLLVTINAQQFVDYSNPKEYVIADITVSGVKYLSKDALIMLSGLKIGQKIQIPGDEISDAIQRLWDQGLFSDVKISITKIEGDKVYLNFYLQEQPRLLNLYIKGVNRSQEEDLRDILDLTRGKKVSNSLLIEAEKKIKDYFAKKGYPFVEVTFKMVDDTMYQNVVNLYINIDKKNRVKIKHIIIRGNEQIPRRKILAWMKETKQRRIYRFWNKTNVWS